jgi:hypothetical protein
VKAQADTRERARIRHPRLSAVILTKVRAVRPQWRVLRFGFAAVLAAALVLALASPAPAATVALGGSPINVLVGERGQLQAFRTDRADPGSPPGIFFPATDELGDAGFFLAFPSGYPGDSTPRIYGFDGTAGPHGLDEYTPVSQGAITGSGTASDPFKQVTAYSVGTILSVTQATTYVNGSQEFRIRWEVHNDAPGVVFYKALAAADFFFDGDDAGTGIFTAGPPRFIGGTNLDSGSSGGFVEVPGPGLAPWSAYQALPFGGAPDEVWGKVEGAASSSAATFDNTVVPVPVDNAGGVEWDQDVTGAGLASGATRAFELIVRSAVPSALQLNPTNVGSRQGTPISVTATATDSNGQPYAGKTLRFQLIGPNATTGSLPLDAAGSGVITDPGANAGTDTVVAFIDFNDDGTREPTEPQASALATFVDAVPPTCTIKVSGSVIGGLGAGKPLVINVDCGEGATVTVNTTMQTIPGGGGSATTSRKPVRIKLKPVKKKISPGHPVPFKIKIPPRVAKKYAGQTLKATVRTTARDSSGNQQTVSKAKRVKLAKLHTKKHD